MPDFSLAWACLGFGACATTTPTTRPAFEDYAATSTATANGTRQFAAQSAEKRASASLEEFARVAAAEGLRAGAGSPSS